MGEEEKILEFIQQEYENYDNYVRDLLDLYNKKQQKVKERLEQVKDRIQELTDEQGYWGSTELLNEEEFLLELLEEEN